MTDSYSDMRKVFTAIAAIAASVLVTGCGTASAGEYTQAAMDEIGALEYEAAAEALNTADEQGENPAMIARARGIVDLALAQYDEAVEEFNTALSYSDWRVDEFDYDVNYYLADAYEHKKDYQAAVDTYTAILNLEDKEVLALYKRGCDHLLLSETEEATADFDRAIRLSPDDYDLRIEIAGRLTENGYEDEGRAYLEQFLLEKEKKLSKFDKGRIYFYMEDYENAKIYFEDARDDDDQNTILFLGKTYEMLGDYNYATSTYQNYLTRHPEAAVIYNQLGLSRIKSGDYTGARDAFASAGNLPGSGLEQVLAFNEIVANEYTGDFAKAKELMNEYLRKYPDDQAAVRENIFLSTR